MGVKGWLGFHLKVKKTSRNVFQALVAAMVDYILQNCQGDIATANATLLKIGSAMAETLLFEYSDKIGKHATSFQGFLETFNLATKVMLGVKFDSVTWDAAARKIVYTLKECPLCENIRMSDEYKGLKFCNSLSGVFQHVLTLRGFSSECEEVQCMTWGDPACVWELREV